MLLSWMLISLAPMQTDPPDGVHPLVCWYVGLSLIPRLSSNLSMAFRLIAVRPIGKLVFKLLIDVTW